MFSHTFNKQDAQNLTANYPQRLAAIKKIIADYSLSVIRNHIKKAATIGKNITRINLDSLDETLLRLSNNSQSEYILMYIEEFNIKGNFDMPEGDKLDDFIEVSLLADEFKVILEQTQDDSGAVIGRGVLEISWEAEKDESDE